MSQIKIKSKAGDARAYVWLMLDVGGKLQAVCYESKSATEALSAGFMAKASINARGAFIKAQGRQVVRGTGLVDLVGRPLHLPTT